MVEMINTSISNVIGFMNTLVPILLALIMTTGSVVSANLLQPMIIFSIVFIGNAITLVVLPITFVATILGILSNLSDKVQIGKLSKFLKSSITWALGFIITMFVSVLSLEGGLTSSVDGITIKGLKTATSTFIPVVGKALGDSVDTVLGATSVIKNAVRGGGNNITYRNMCNTNYKTCSYHCNVSFYSSNNRAIGRQKNSRSNRANGRYF